MLEGVTSCAHMPATSAKLSEMPIFLEEQGTWMATLSRTLLHSSLSLRWVRMNSTGSYSENLHLPYYQISQHKLVPTQWL